jgi:hypothetical protein
LTPVVCRGSVVARRLFVGRHMRNIHLVTALAVLGLVALVVYLVTRLT